MKIKSFIFPLALFMCSCSVNTKIQQYFVFDNTFKNVKEIENGEEVTSNKWFDLRSSSIEMMPDKTYHMELNYKNGNSFKCDGQYFIMVGDIGHSGTGYITLNNEKINVDFERSYFISFEMPESLIPEGETVRTIVFQRW